MLHQDPVAEPSQWEPDIDMYRHNRSSIVHVMVCGNTNNRFSCGNIRTPEYTKVPSISFLEFKKCKRCTLARPIKDVGQLASALHKVNKNLST